MRQEEILSLKKAPDAADLLKRVSATQTDDLNATTGVRVVDSGPSGDLDARPFRRPPSV